MTLIYNIIAYTYGIGNINSTIVYVHIAYNINHYCN